MQSLFKNHNQQCRVLLRISISKSVHSFGCVFIHVSDFSAFSSVVMFFTAPVLTLAIIYMIFSFFFSSSHLDIYINFFFFLFFLISSQYLSHFSCRFFAVVKAADCTKCSSRLITFQSLSCHDKFFFFFVRTTHQSLFKSAIRSLYLTIFSNREKVCREGENVTSTHLDPFFKIRLHVGAIKIQEIIINS